MDRSTTPVKKLMKISVPKAPKRRRAIDFMSDRLVPKLSSSPLSTRNLGKKISFGTNQNLAKACGVSVDSTIFDYGTMKAKSNANISLFNEESQFLSARLKSRFKRQIPKRPERILDVPGIIDDFYMHVLDWSKKKILVVALGEKLYAWNEPTGDVLLLYDLIDECITSVAFSSNGNKLAIGDSSGFVRVFSVMGSFNSRRFFNHLCTLQAATDNSIAHVCWSLNDHLAIAYSSGDIFLYNLNSSIDNEIRPYRSWIGIHSDRVVGMQWDPLDKSASTLATGGNDNKVIIWNSNEEDPVLIIHEHQSAIRALSFCPWHKNILATGGGNQDQHIRIFNIETGKCLKSIFVGSQVCDLLWSKNNKELLTSQSSEQDQLVIWSYPSMEKVGCLPGHTQRPLYLALSPDGETLASASSDENLKFWKCFSPREEKGRASINTRARGSIHNTMTIR